MANALLEHENDNHEEVTTRERESATPKSCANGQPAVSFREPVISSNTPVNGQPAVSDFQQPTSQQANSTELNGTTCEAPDETSVNCDDQNLKRSKSRLQKTRRSNEGKQQQRPLQENEIFTFHPVVSDNSAKIAAKLGTDFWQRQKIHADKQMEQRRAIEEAHAVYTRRLSPVQDKDIRLKNNAKPKRPHGRSVTMPSIFKSSSEENLTTKKTEETARSADASESMPVIKEKSRTPALKKRSSTHTFAEKPCKSSLERSRSGSNCKADNADDELSDDDTKKVPVKKKIHYRSLTNEELDANHQRMMKAKEVATKAVKNKKVFLCCGPYQTIRGTLRHRGWVEKYFKPRVHTRKHSTGSGDDSDDSADNNMSYEPVEEQGDIDTDSQYGIMSRVVRNCTPMMIWTLRRDDIDYKSLRKDQVINHFGQAGTFTTKAGLCKNLRNSFLFGDRDCVHFYPRCYVLSSDEGRDEFIDDYRLTVAQSMLKLTLERHREWYETSKKTSQKSSKCADLTEKPVVLSAKLIQQALRACYQHIDFMEHTDIEEDYHNKYYMTSVMWDMLIKGYSQVVHDGAIIADATKMVSECVNVMEKITPYFPQSIIDGYHSMWIVKPGAKSRGRGISVMNRLEDMLALTSESTFKKENQWVIQKYIERPLLVYNTKFDIRQWFLVTDTNPLVFWFYKDCYIRFCGKEFSLTELDAQTHLANNSIQKHYEPGERCSELPDDNMWSSDTFRDYLNKRGDGAAWDNLIYPQMKNAIKMSLLCCQDAIESRKNSFELYGADFMLSEDLKPWLIEINSSPALGASTPVTEVLCKQVIEDTFKVVIDRRSNKNCDIGRFELAFKQPNVSCSTYMGLNLQLVGEAIASPRGTTKQTSKPKAEQTTKVEPSTSADSKVESSSSESASTTVKPVKARTQATRTVLKLERNVKPENTAKTKVTCKSKSRSPVLRMTVRRNNEERHEKIYRLDMPLQKSDTSLVDEQEAKIPPIVTRVNSKFILGSKACAVNQKELTPRRESPRNNRSHDHTLSGSELTVPTTKTALTLSPRSPTLGWPCSLTNFTMKDTAVPVVASHASHQAVRFNGTVPFVVDSTRATAQAYRQRYSHAPQPSKKTSRTELFGSYHKLYVNQIDLKPGHGVKQIQNVFL